MKGLIPQSRTFFSCSLVPSEYASWICCLGRWLYGALTLSDSIHQVCGLWGLLRGVGQCQLPLMAFLGPPGISYKTICQWLLLVLDLEVPRRGQVIKPGQAATAGLGPLSERYEACPGWMLLVWEILGKSEARAKTGLLYGKPTGNGFGGLISQGISRMGQTVLARLMETQLWYLPAGSGKRAHQRNNDLCKHFSLEESCPFSPHLDTRQFSSSLYVSGAFPAAAPALELRASESG